MELQKSWKIAVVCECFTQNFETFIYVIKKKNNKYGFGLLLVNEKHQSANMNLWLFTDFN